MSKVKASLPSGTRDFLPQEVARRNYLFGVIKSVFEKYGFQQIETPVLENLTTLTGKYGDEGDKLLFKILNSGDPFDDFSAEDWEYLKRHNDEIVNKVVEGMDFDTSQKIDAKYVSQVREEARKRFQSIISKMVERGLRYDLTVPLARYVVQHQGDLTFPFKRYHIAPVWRADRPQKGRYREFYQCDADVIGSDSLYNEVELTAIYLEVFEHLGIPVTIRVNHRVMIEELLKLNEIHNSVKEVVSTIDKLDKVSWEGEKGIAVELKNLGLTGEQISGLHNYLLTTTQENFVDRIQNIDALYDMKFLFNFFQNEPRVQFDPTLVRGLNYYTGLIWEVKANAGTISSSVGGGGRYANLTELFGGQNMSGVGISFGVERIYDVMTELNLFPETVLQGVQILFVAREPQFENFAFEQVQKLRAKGISAELFLGNAKKQKHFKYAEDKGISFMAEVGSDEAEQQIFRVKNLKTREEKRLSFDELVGEFINL